VDLLLGILDPEEDLREVTFEDGRIEYALASKLEKLAGVAQAKPVWEARQRGTLTAEQARRGLSNLIASDRAAIRDWYKLPSTADDPTLFSGVKPVIISITRPIDPMTDDYVKKALARARGQGANLIFLRLDCEGGLPESAERIVQSLGELDQEIKTVAFVESRALGVASLLLWACDEIVLGADARIGDLPRKVSTAGSEAIDAATLAVLEEKAQALAARKGHPPGIAAGIFNRTMSVVQALDTQTGAVTAVLQSEVDRNPGRYLVQNRIKPAGDVLVVTSENAVALGVARRVGVTRAELYREYGVEGNVREEEPSWVDALVTVLNTPWVSWLLLFVGLFMLILELKLPGVGLPAIISALCFILFFWGHSRAGTADTLEILLFLTGIVCLVLELFVFPGIGVFGVCGVLLVLVSIVMASHTFVWPTQDYEYRQLGGTLLAVMGTIVAVGVGAFTLGKFLPSFPVFRRLVLVPEPATGSGEDFAKPALDPSETPLLFLLGERGRTTTVLRPTGKARFGDFLADVTADGFYIEANTPVEVVEVRGSKVIVKRA
jgi:membrane-bound serine protease (ClpP class)